VPDPTRIPRVVLLGAIVLFGACGEEPAPRHPTKTHKHKKKHVDADDVVVKDDSGDDSRPHHGREVAADDRGNREDTKKSDDEDTEKSERTAKKKKKKHEDDDEDASKSERAATKKKHGDDDEDVSKSDGADAKTDDAPAKKPVHEPTAKRALKKTVKRKHAAASKPVAAASKPAAAEPKGDAGAGEIEMDEDPLAGGTGETAVAATAGTTTDTSDEAEASAAVAAPMPAPAPTTSPLALNDRSLVTRHGELEVHGGLPTLVLTLPGAMPGMTTSTTSEGLAIGATYGIGEHVEIGGDYAVSLSPGSVSGPLTLHGAYLALARPKLDVAIAGAFVVDPTTPTTSYGLQLGGWVRYRATPKVAVFTGLPALPSSPVSLSKLSLALPPLPYQLAIGLTSGSAIAFDLPAGVGYQLAPNVYTFAMLNLAHLRLSNTQTALLFADFIPVTVGGFYSRDRLDLGATFADDLKQGTDYLSFELVARYALH